MPLDTEVDLGSGNIVSDGDHAAYTHYCTDPDVTWGRGRGCPLVVHYWADLQLEHGLRC